MTPVLEPGTPVRIHPCLDDRIRFPRNAGPGLIPDMLKYAGKYSVIKDFYLIGNEARYTLSDTGYSWIADWFDLDDYEVTDSCASISEDHEMLGLI